MTTQLDTGERCDRHLDEIFPVRCYDCGTAALDAEHAPRRAPTVNGYCALHPEYPSNDRFECARCARDREAGEVVRNYKTKGTK